MIYKNACTQSVHQLVGGWEELFLNHYISHELMAQVYSIRRYKSPHLEAQTTKRLTRQLEGIGRLLIEGQATSRKILLFHVRC